MATSSGVDGLASYRARNPILDEDVKLTLFGLREGAPARRTKRMLALVIALALTGALIGAMVETAFPLAVGGALSGGLLALPVLASTADRVGVFMSDRRTVIIRQGRRSEPEAIELAPDAVTACSIDQDPEPFWVFGRICRIRLCGAAGDVLTLDLVGVDGPAAHSVVSASGIRVAPLAVAVGPARATTGGASFWLPKALLVGLFFTFGGAFVLLAIPASQDEGVGGGLVAFGIGAALLAGGEALRRRLLRRGP